MSMLVNRRRDNVQSCCGMLHRHIIRKPTPPSCRGRRRFLDLVRFALPELPHRIHHRVPGEDASTTGSNVENEFDAFLFPTVVVFAA